MKLIDLLTDLISDKTAVGDAAAAVVVVADIIGLLLAITVF